MKRGCERCSLTRRPPTRRCTSNSAVRTGKNRAKHHHRLARYLCKSSYVQLTNLPGSDRTTPSLPFPSLFLLLLHSTTLNTIIPPHLNPTVVPARILQPTVSCKAPTLFGCWTVVSFIGCRGGCLDHKKPSSKRPPPLSKRRGTARPLFHD